MVSHSLAGKAPASVAGVSGSARGRSTLESQSQVQFSRGTEVPASPQLEADSRTSARTRARAKDTIAGRIVSYLPHAICSRP